MYSVLWPGAAGAGAEGADGDGGGLLPDERVHHHQHLGIPGQARGQEASDGCQHFLPSDQVELYMLLYQCLQFCKLYGLTVTQTFQLYIDPE